MNNLTEQPNKQSNLESIESDFSLTKNELGDFKRLPKPEQEKLKKSKLTELQEMSNKLDIAFQEAVRTGKLDEAQKLRKQLEKEIVDLKQQIEITRIELPEGAVVMEVIPDHEITSAETAIKKMEKEGYKIDDGTKTLLNRVNWKEKLKTSYEVVSILVGKLFDDDDMHTYAEIKDEAKNRGFKLVPASLVPSIRLSCSKSDEWKTIAMEAIRDHNDYPWVFDCDDNDSDSQLNCFGGLDIEEWSYDSWFFFVLK